MATVTAKVDLAELALAPSKTEQENAARTHKMIREHLESDPALDRYKIDTYLQGSYKNSTNVRGDSDVDMGSCTSEIFVADVERLPTEAPSPWVKSARERYQETFVPATWSFWDYRLDVLSSLRRKYGSDSVIDGNKAIKVLGNSTRLDADVLPCIQHRHYWRFTGSSTDYSRGICFYTKQIKLVVNFPEQHFENLTDKNVATDGKVKGCARILKRIRNELVDRGDWKRERSPSYYLECLLWNVPDRLFVGEYDVVMCDVLRYLWSDLSEKKGKDELRSYLQANQVYVLFHPEFWNVDDAIEFIERVWTYSFGA